MPLDATHQHSSADIMDADNPHTPISPGGSPPTLAEVLVAGHDATGLGIWVSGIAGGPPGEPYHGLTLEAFAGADVTVQGGSNGPDPDIGGSAILYGGFGHLDNSNPAFVVAHGGGVDGVGGVAEIVAGDGETGSGKAGGDITLTAGAGDGAGRHGLVFLNLPTSDPGVSGALYSDGVPSAGVPKAIMVSGG
jgi:hypothetical protein